MKRVAEFALLWVPFVYALLLCNFALSRTAPGEMMRTWEPAFYSFLPMSFFFAGVVMYYLQREIHDLRNTVQKLQRGTGD